MIGLRERFNKTILKSYQKNYNTHVMAVPRLRSVTLNMTGRLLLKNNLLLGEIKRDLELITGQTPIVCYARRSIAQWSIRKGFPSGAKVTLHRDRMYNFIEKLITIVAPRISDFRGFNRNAFDCTGNYSIGIKDYTCFPEIRFDSLSKVRGLDIAISTSACNSQECFQLLEHIGFPFNKMD